MDRLVGGQPGVTAWSQFGFSQVAVDGQEIPVMGLQRDRGSVEPPTTSGRPMTGPGQIELGTATLHQLGKHVGDTVRVGTGRTARALTITGTVTLPSFGLILADHVSLGRGAMLLDSTLLAIQGAPQAARASGLPQPSGPDLSAVAIDMAPGSSADARLLVRRIVSADPDGMPGSTDSLDPERVRGHPQRRSSMGSQPLTLAASSHRRGGAGRLRWPCSASVRRRRRQLAVLKTLGLTPRPAAGDRRLAGQHDPGDRLPCRAFC